MTATQPFPNALPFAVSLPLAGTVIAASIWGGWTIVLIPFYGLILSSVIDRMLSDNNDNPDPQTDESKLYWHRILTFAWVPIQIFFLLFALIAATRFDHLSTAESVYLFVAIGVATGGIGIVYAHELIHQKVKFERDLGDALLAMVLYGHFHTKHIRLHHRYVGTPSDPVTARYNEGFHRFFVRLLPEGLIASWKLEADMLKKRDLPLHHKSNPFWRYVSWALIVLAVAALIGGWFGIVLFLIQSFIAIMFLELTNYVEHYGLVRKHLGDGKFEHIRPHHSWNSSRRFTNYLLINLQRHSDHHYKPDRRFPLLQTFSESDAPQLPFGYPIMAAMALVPPIWRRVMNPKVRKWRAMYYPEITDWKPYTEMSHRDDQQL